MADPTRLRGPTATHATDIGIALTNVEYPAGARNAEAPKTEARKLGGFA
jgi:hypothetical protein